MEGLLIFLRSLLRVSVVGDTNKICISLGTEICGTLTTLDYRWLCVSSSYHLPMCFCLVLTEPASGAACYPISSSPSVCFYQGLRHWIHLGHSRRLRH